MLISLVVQDQGYPSAVFSRMLPIRQYISDRSIADLPPWYARARLPGVHFEAQERWTHSHRGWQPWYRRHHNVKWHTDFDGKLESGLFKMMAIGLSKFAGARQYHAFAIDTKVVDHSVHGASNRLEGHWSGACDSRSGSWFLSARFPRRKDAESPACAARCRRRFDRAPAGNTCVLTQVICSRR